MRRFDAAKSTDNGNTWSKIKASGWAISDVHDQELEDDYGFLIALTLGDTMIDVGIPEKMFKLMIKDVEKLKVSDATIRRRTQGVPINPSDSGTENQS